jgi:hypothetical protein
MFRSIVRAVALLVSAACACGFRANAQEFSSSALPDAPSSQRAATPRPAAPKQKPTNDGAYEHSMRGAVSCGGGYALQNGSLTGRMGMCGGSFTIIPFTATEIGVMGPLNNPAHFYVSEDFVAPITKTIKRLHGAPLGLVGYTKIVSNSNRFDYGIGWDHHLGDGKSLAFEARDYWQPNNAIPHILMFRLSLAAGGDWD